MLQQDISEGGLNAPNLKMLYKSQRVAWLTRMMQHPKLTFVKVLLRKLKNSSFNNVLKSHFSDGWVKRLSLAPFYKEMLAWYREIVPRKEPNSGKEVRLQLIWNNEAIRVGRRPVYHNPLAEQGIMYIDDFLDANGLVSSYHEFMGRCRSRCVDSINIYGMV